MTDPNGDAQTSELRSALQAAVGSRYEVGAAVGEGGMAMVFEALDMQLGRRVAIKVMLPEVASSMARDRFQREIEIVAKLRHPHILPIHDSGGNDEIVYFVMPFVAGESLADRIGREGMLPIPDALRVFSQVGSALQYAHDRGIVHRDVKPGNVLLAEGGAVVADFGVARALDGGGAPKLTQTGMMVGTPSYMSVEQSSGESGVDARSDQYSLACVLFEMLTGEPPYTGRTFHAVVTKHLVGPIPSAGALRRTVPEHIDQAIEAALAKAPADRFESVSSFVEAVAGTGSIPLTESTIAKVPSGPTYQVRRKTVGMLAAALGVAAAAVGIWQLTERNDTGPLDPDLIAVAPFRVAGAVDTRLAGIGEGMLELFYTRLPGSEGIRTVYPGTSIPVWEDAGGDITQREATQVARSLGAGKVLLGQVFGSGSRIVLSATLHEVPSGDEVARAENVEGSADSLLVLVDRLAVELLAEESGEASRLSDLLTTDLGALRPYLAGRRAHARGAYQEATRQYSAALERDSSFAIAALGLASAGALAEGQGQLEGEEIAWANRDRLNERDRLYLTALVGPRFPGRSSVADAVEAWEAAAAAMPDRAEPWYELGDRLYHWRDVLGRADAVDRAEAAFRRALEIDPTFGPALEHLIDAVALRGAAAEMAVLSRRYEEAVAGGGDLTEYFRWRIALARGDEQALEEVRSRFSELPTFTLRRFYGAALVNGLPYADVLASAEELRRRATTDFEVIAADRRSRHLAIEGGRPSEALDLAVAIGHVERAHDPAYAWVFIREALYSDGDSLTAARAVSLNSQGPGPPTADPDGVLAEFRRVCALSLWRAAHGDVSQIPRDLSSLRSLPLPQGSDGGDAELCMDLLDVLRFASEDAEGAVPAIERLDSLLASGPDMTTYMMTAANLELAEIFEDRGQPDRALRAVRRRIYQYDRTPFALATMLREEGRLATMTGDYEGAIRAFEHFLALRPNPEPEFVSEVEAIQGEVARLRGLVSEASN